MKNRISFLAVLMIMAQFSCKTGDTVLLNSIGDEDRQLLENLEIQMMRNQRYENEGNTESVERLFKELKGMKTANREFLSRLLALEAEWILLTRGDADRLKVEALLKEAHKTHPHEQRIFLVRSRLANSEKKRDQFLTDSLETPGVSRIYEELGFLSFSRGQFSDAARWYALAVDNLPFSYHPLFSAAMDQSIRLSKSHLEGEILALYALPALTMEQMITLTAMETPLLSPQEDFERLKHNSFIHDGETTKESPALRGEAAGFLAALFVRNRKDPLLISESGRYYKEELGYSPLTDVALSDWFFDAVVFLLERNIMDLPDGENFFPNRNISGEELQESLKSLKNLMEN